MKLEDLLQQIQAELEARANEELVVKYARYFKEGYDAYGIASDDMNELKKRFLTKYRDVLGLDGFFELGDLLMKSGKYEEASLGIVMVAGFKKELEVSALPRIKSWLDSGVRNWAHSDIICSELLGPLWNSGKIELGSLVAWRDAPSPWTRRAVPVSMLAPLKRGDDVSGLIAFIDPMMTDEVRVVHQGLGWFLREAWKKEPVTVEAFLLKWKDDAARLIYQYATEKMTKDERVRFRKDKKASS